MRDHQENQNEDKAIVAKATNNQNMLTIKDMRQGADRFVATINMRTIETLMRWVLLNSRLPGFDILLMKEPVIYNLNDFNSDSMNDMFITSDFNKSVSNATCTMFSQMYSQLTTANNDVDTSSDDSHESLQI